MVPKQQDGLRVPTSVTPPCQTDTPPDGPIETEGTFQAYYMAAVVDPDWEPPEVAEAIANPSMFVLPGEEEDPDPNDPGCSGDCGGCDDQDCTCHPDSDDDDASGPL